MPKLKSLSAAAQEREMREHINNALLVLVKAAGKLPIPADALRGLRAGDNLQLEAMPDGSLMLTYVFVDSNAPEAG